METVALITGGCGFLGHHLTEHIIKTTDWKIKIVDKLTYAANGFDRLRDINCFDEKRVSLFTVDFTRPFASGVKKELGDIDYVFHLGAETHVDKSITDPEPFVMSNVVGTMHLMNYARMSKGLKKFFMFSTDEVFGPAPVGVHYKEWDRYNSGNPYAASKAGAEELALAYANTYKFPVVITHCMNIFGERQHPEKFIPLVIRGVLTGKEVMIHADTTRTIAGTRFYIHARNVAAALTFLVNEACVGDKYNIVGEKEVSNLDMALFIATLMDKPLRYKMTDFHSTRPGHDLRYALSGEKMKKMGWQIPIPFEQSLEKTVRWFLQPENKKWLEVANEVK